YDAFGNLTSQSRSITAANTETYMYDPLQRLTKTTRAFGAAVNYGYTASGNLTFKDDFSAAGANAYTYASPNSTTNNCGPHAVNTVQMRSNQPSATYLCDANGNVIDGSTLTASFDVENRPHTLTRTILGPGVGEYIFCNHFETGTNTCPNPPPAPGSTTW